MSTLADVHARLFLRKQDYHATFDSPHGRRVLADMARFGHVFKTTMVDGAASAELEGRRQQVLRIMELMRLSHDDLAAMIREEEAT